MTKMLSIRSCMLHKILRIQDPCLQNGSMLTCLQNPQKCMPCETPRIWNF